MIYLPFFIIHVLVGFALWWFMEEDLGLTVYVTVTLLWPLGIIALMAHGADNKLVWNAPQRRRTALVESDYLETVQLINS